MPTLLDRFDKQAASRADRMVSFSKQRKCRHQQVAQHFSENFAPPCGRCDVCAPLEAGAAAPMPETRPLPSDIARVIVEAIAGQRWPVGRKGLTALLRGSVSASPTARRNQHYGALAGANTGIVRKWIELLIQSENLELFEDDGYQLLRVGDVSSLPKLATTPVTSARAGRSEDGGAAED